MSVFKLECGTHHTCGTRVINQGPRSMMSWTRVSWCYIYHE